MVNGKKEMQDRYLYRGMDSQSGTVGGGRMKEQEAIICLKADKEYLMDMKI